MALFDKIEDYFNNVVNKLRTDVENRRRQDRTLDKLNAVLKPKGVLQVDKAYFYAKNNASEHRTIKYELIHRQPETPIYRRGQPFYFVIRFIDGKSFVPEKDILRIYFNFGPGPSVAKHTQAILNVDGEQEFLKDKFEWDVRIHGQDKDSVTIQVQIPPDVPVGIWKCQILTGEKDNPQKLRIFDCTEDIYILFNPWCPDDSVYMEQKDDEKLLDEYVLNDVGKIWMGSYGSAQGREWVFGQYDDAALPVTMYLLERCGLAHTSRSNPILISRALTKMVNSNDGDNGVLEGRWDGDYADGTAPSAWTGSVKILEDYLLTKRSVQYGQCWVFAGVLTTLCRTLGIPARPVTNVVSAHDANNTLTIDRYYDSKNNELDYDPFNPSGGKDSVWNFHVWVEAWMSRPDLPKGYGGWQAIDATPQEHSEGFYQMGPASVEAVKNGEIGLAYDVPFVLAEVNADLVRWKEDKRSEIGFIQIDTNRYNIGRQILTKKANVFDRRGQSDAEDITMNYKSSEGTQEERIALLNAVRASTRAKRFFQYPNVTKEDVSFDLIELERVPIGDSFSVTVIIENRSDEVRTVNAVLSATTNYYNGVKAREVRRATGLFVLQPKARDELSLPVSADDYIPKLVEYGMMKLHAMASVQETNQTWAEEDDFQVLMPSLDSKVSGVKKIGQTVNVTFTFKNPLNIRLTNCKLNYEGPGLIRSGSEECSDVQPGETVSKTVQVVPKYAGEHRLVGCFHSREFAQITGTAKVAVTK